jgi:hypothetical protein
MEIILLVIFTIIVYWVILAVLKQYGLRRISEKVSKTMLILNRANSSDKETYSKWIEKSNPEQLWARIIAHTTGNKKLLGELSSKLLQACEAIGRLSQLDNSVKILIEAGSYDINFLEEQRNNRKTLIALIEQSFSDIKNELKI